MSTELSRDAVPESEIEASNKTTPKAQSSRPLLLNVVAVCIALYVGWEIRDEYLLSAEFGAGYALGIIGGSMMLLLLLYPIRKRFHHTSWLIFSTKNWFKIHMALGVIGPLLILYHCNFSLGSTNSNIALISMLLMVASGLVGRFIYGKIHYGLYGEKIQLKELLDHQLLSQQQLQEDKQKAVVQVSDKVMDKLTAYGNAFKTQRGVLSSFFVIFYLGITTRFYQLFINRLLRQNQSDNALFMRLSDPQQKQQLKKVSKHIRNYLSTIRKIAGLSFYERLFSLWHMLHLPIFFMLVVTGFVHVYAVHVY
jgi:hypothetical protein